MRHSSFRLALRLFSVVFCGLLVSSAAAQDPRFQWFAPTVPDGAAAGWQRWILDGSAHPAEEARLALATSVRCSLYINGQRLLKMDRLQPADQPLRTRTWNVSSLLRPGRNLVAIQYQSDTSTAAFAVSLAVRRGDKWNVVGGQWKSAPAAPPVGWQQTDFNDRDWPATTPGSLPAGLAEPVLAERIEAPVLPARVRNGLPFSFEDGDHVCLVGATFIERAQLSEHLETALAGAIGKRRVTFRNLGWSADTAFAESRGIFDAPAVGYLRMVEHIRAEEPTVVFICYGQNEALTPGQTPENFTRQFGQFLDELAASGIPCVLLSPHELFPAQPPIPSPARFNNRIRVYTEAVGSLAQSRQLAFVDLFSDFNNQMLSVQSLLQPAAPGAPATAAFTELSDNGMHLSELGYACASLVLRQRLMGIPAQPAAIKIDAAARSLTASGIELEKPEWTSDGSSLTVNIRQPQLSPIPVRLDVTGARLAPAEQDTAARPDDAAIPLVAVSADGTTCLADSTAPWEQLRQLIRAKNELYFHRWRPQNITYLFGFRKHEQGNNAADIARFDPFIQELEAKILAAQQPQWQRMVIRLKK
jgi:lysophospholipase L1-like esterase